MNLNIYENYKITVNGVFSKQVAFDEFEKQDINESKIDNGGRILNLLGDIFKGYDMSDVVIDVEEGKYIFIVNTFNPNNGESGKITYTIEKVDKN